jgi:hypothetical protein
MRIEALDPDREAEWDDFCRAEPGAWFWHTTDWTRFMLAAKPEREGRSLAFAVRDARGLLAIAPLTVEGDGFTLGGGSCWAPAVRADLDESSAAEVHRLVLDHVDELAGEHGVVRAGFQVSPLTAGTFAPAALRAQYAEIGRTSQILDLTRDLDALRRGMSKGHRSAVKRGTAQFRCEALSGPEATSEALHAFRALTDAAAGRATRPAESYERLADWTRRRDALLVFAYDGDTRVGGAFLSVFRNRAYYSLAAMDRSRSRLPIGQAVQWTAIEWLKANGVTTYELGLQQFGPVPHDAPSDKELAISRFKRGFGGVQRLAPAFEKWYSAEAFRAAHAVRADAYAASLETAQEMRATSSSPSP